MDAKSIRLRLSGHGDVTAHRDGSFTLSLRRPVGEYWRERLRREVALQVPGAQIRFDRCRLSADPYFEVHEVLFRVGPAPDSAPGVSHVTSHAEGSADEVATAEGAVIPARMCVSLGMRPGSSDGPGRLSPLELVGRAGSGRAA
jgi:hypothetical protein